MLKRIYRVLNTCGIFFFFRIIFIAYNEVVIN
uniref:Uncharacterized protein n=1 Tax=Siphoviridae sp. ctWuM9 TaxID=2826364 RepID=A0A8S5MF10_9CAUD|nr:MAG TPA: hypothetical protein [Siphoviridae sp. ctWuM9]